MGLEKCMNNRGIFAHRHNQLQFSIHLCHIPFCHAFNVFNKPFIVFYKHFLHLQWYTAVHRRWPFIEQ